MSEWQCINCYQWIIQSTTQFYTSGKGKIMNFMDGVGGYKGELHLCPNRKVSNRFEANPADNFFFMTCVKCACDYHTGVYCRCPNCIKKVCRNCGAMSPLTKTPESTTKIVEAEYPYQPDEPIIWGPEDYARSYRRDKFLSELDSERCQVCHGNEFDVDDFNPKLLELMDRMRA
jgi:hypothetical protein